MDRQVGNSPESSRSSKSRAARVAWAGPLLALSLGYAPIAVAQTLGVNNHCYVPGAGQSDPPAGMELPLFFVSLHHGTHDNKIPLPGEVREVATKTVHAWAIPADLVVAVAASPCQTPGRGYLGFAGDEYKRDLSAAYHNASLDSESSLACLGAQGNTEVIVGSAWTLVDAHNEAYPDEIKGKEGINYGVFRVKHRRSGAEFYIVTGTVEDCCAQHTPQIQHLLQRGRQLARTGIPAFVGGDFNFQSSDTSPGATTVKQYMSIDSLPLSIGQQCTISGHNYTYDTDGLMHYVLYQPPEGQRRLTLRAFVLDPDHPSSPLDESASRIVSQGIPANHTLVGALFQIAGHN